MDYIALDKPEAALRVANCIYNATMNLAATPRMDRTGVVAGTLELIFHPWPYIAVYKVFRDAVRILRIRHASQMWP